MDASESRMGVDPSRLARERLARAQAAMERGGLDALILFRDDNGHYVSACRHSQGIPANVDHLPYLAVVGRRGLPYIFSTDFDGIPERFPRDHHLVPPFVDSEAGIRRLVGMIGETLGEATRGTIGIDEGPVAIHLALQKAFPRARFLDGEEAMVRARLIKTADEIALLRRAHEITDQAMADVMAAIRPGVREVELNGIFMQRIAALGSNWSFYEGTWCVIPPTRAELPFLPDRLHPYRHLPSQRVLQDGDLVSVDTGALYQSYLADFGRTWFCGTATRPTPRQRDLYQRWRACFQAMLEVARPGRTVADLHRAAGEGGRTLCAHGAGLGIEPPLAGGPAERMADESVILTEAGPEVYSHFPHGPLAG